MNLIDKIYKYGIMRDRYRSDLDPRTVEHTGKLLRNAVCVEIGSVARWFHDKGSPVPMDKLSPVFTLPFDVMWLEYLHVWNDDGIPIPDVHVGVLMAPPHEKDPMHGVHPGETLAARGMTFMACEKLFQRPAVAIGEQFAAYRIEQALHRLEVEKVPRRDGVTEDVREKITREVGSMIVPALAAVSFFHCSNVRIVNEWPSKALSKRFEQKHGVPLHMMKSIDIHKPRDVRGDSPGEEHSERELAAHLVRGHFKRYNNLFGSIAGMWFWRPHVRGEGEPLPRSYNVHAPTKEHHGKCVVEI